MNIKLSQSFLFINSKDYFSKNLIKMRKILTFAIAIISTEFTYAQLLNNDFEQQKKIHLQNGILKKMILMM